MTSSHNKPLILVDGSSYLFRAYHALPPLTNSKGMPTGAIYGVLNMLRRLVKDYSPTHIAVIFDPKGPTFRKELYPAYKANRETMPDDLQVQIAPLHTAIKALGIPLMVIAGVEADDVIATLAKQATGSGMQTIISTGDKDLAQIVDDHTLLINTMSNIQLDRAGVKEKFGIFPEQMIDYLTLIGDSVDNIPGVHGVGPKTAVKWLTQYHSLDNLIAHADDITGKVGTNLRQQLSELPLMRELIVVKTDIELPQLPQQLTLVQPQHDVLIELFTDLEFKNWLAEIIDSNKLPATKPTCQYQTILTHAEFEKWRDKLTQANSFAFNITTTSPNPINARIVGVSIAMQTGEAAYIPLMHNYIGVPNQLDKQWVLSQLQPLLTTPDKIIIGQNLKYDLQVLANENINVEAKLWDSMLAAYILDSSALRYDLTTLALKHLNHTNISLEQIAGKGSKQLTFDQIPLETAESYAAETADLTLQLYPVLNKPLADNQDLQRVLYEIELPLLPILTKMERHGVLIDTKMLQQQSAALQMLINKIEQEVYTIAGENFNLSSPKQLQTILYDKLKLPALKKTPTGQPSTAEDVLQELALNHDIARLILEYRSLAKLKSTYTDSLPQQINPHTGRIHTSYQQTGTITGRLSSKDPNLQNIPARSLEGRKIRQAFIAPPGYQIMSADYSQVELRIMAHLSQDPGLLTAFAQNQDVHSSTAAEVFGVNIQTVTPDQRRSAKAINFGLMYGMSSFGLAQQLGISRQQAQDYIEVYFHRYPNVHHYMEQARQLAAQQGYASTLYGRRVAIPDIKSSNQQRRLAAERAAINAPLQGSAADIIKLAMICIDQWIKQNHSDIHMIMQVHDELVFEVADSLIDEAKQHIRHCMEHVLELSVPLLVDIGIGHNWDEAH